VISLSDVQIHQPLVSSKASGHNAHPKNSLRKDLAMSVQTVGKQFVELCRQGKNFDVMRTMYDPKIVSVEGDGKETAGQAPVIKKSEDWVSDKTFNGETVAGPFFNGANPDQFVVFFTLDITPKATGKRTTLEEVGVYTVKNDLITREQFFYDGAH
jgi:predicted ribonuclease toxin of YeeF-YezG toxin-antitoxin module